MGVEKLTYWQVENLVKLYWEKIVDKKIKAKTAFKCTYIFYRLIEVNEEYKEKLKELTTRYAETDESGQIVFNNDGIALKKDCFKEFQVEFNRLMETEACEVYPIFTFEDIDELDLTVGECKLLEPLVDKFRID